MRLSINLSMVLFITLFSLPLFPPLNLSSTANAQTQKSTGLPLPRYVSLRAEEVNMRTGPGVRYPVDWVYKRRNLPVEIIAEFGTWRKIRDVEGAQGWIHQSMLSNRRTFSVTGQMRTLRDKEDSKSAPMAKVEPGTIGHILHCGKDSGWCKVALGKYQGWLRRVEFWGAYPREVIN